MSKARRISRKFSDNDVIVLNSLGISLATIAKMFNCHPSTITNRLQTLNIPPSDTRRTFMEDVISPLSESQIEWLSKQLGPSINIKDYVRNLILQEYLKNNV